MGDIMWFRLSPEPSSLGLCCRADGVTFAGTPLLRKTWAGLEARSATELGFLFEAAFGFYGDDEAETCAAGLRVIARALNDGDIVKAAIASVLLKLPEVTFDDATRLARADDLLKANFDPSQPRDESGQWTDDGGNGGGKPRIREANAGILLPAAAAAATALTAAAIEALRNTRRPRPKEDFPTLPPLVTVNPQTNTDARTNAGTDTRADVTNDNEPKKCPAPNEEGDAGKRTWDQLAYQSQINHLEMGWEVQLNGVRYDGCRESDGTMLEAKHNVTEWLSFVHERHLSTIDEYVKIMKQAREQSAGAGWRIVEWHFSNKDSAAFWEKEFRKAGLSNIVVFYTPYDVSKIPDPIRRIYSFALYGAAYPMVGSA